jgi:predicted nucleic acid-binding Zn ribbon protein
MSENYPPPLTLDQLFDSPDEEFDWLVPGLLERGDRLILTGGEGKGKSTLLRQIGVQIASGIHPFTLEAIDPCRVVYIDLENSLRQTKRKLSWMFENSRVAPGENFRIANWPSGLNLMEPESRIPMIEVLNIYSPDLLIIGPMYKLAPSLEQEAVSKFLAEILDEWRTRYGFTLLMESHQPHQVVMRDERYRPERPFGSSLWLRWPEFGICLEDNGTLRHWRGQREEREWPERLRRGTLWPWVTDQRACAVCNNPLTEKQARYCSERCGGVARKQAQRARARLV